MQRFIWRLASLALLLPVILVVGGCAKTPKQTTTQLVDSVRAFDYVAVYSLISDQAKKNYLPDEAIQKALTTMGYQGKTGKEHRRALLALMLGFAQNIQIRAIGQDVEDDKGTVEVRVTFPDICEAIGKNKWIADGKIVEKSELSVLIDAADKGAGDDSLVTQAVGLLSKMDKTEVEGDLYVLKEDDGWKLHRPPDEKLEKWGQSWLLAFSNAMADCASSPFFQEFNAALPFLFGTL